MLNTRLTIAETSENHHPSFPKPLRAQRPPPPRTSYDTSDTSSTGAPDTEVRATLGIRDVPVNLVPGRGIITLVSCKYRIPIDHAFLPSGTVYIDHHSSGAGDRVVLRNAQADRSRENVEERAADLYRRLDSRRL